MLHEQTLFLSEGVQAYWESLAKQYKKKVDDVERAWRQTEDELQKKGMKPSDKDYRAKLMLGTKAKL